MLIICPDDVGVEAGHYVVRLRAMSVVTNKTMTSTAKAISSTRSGSVAGAVDCAKRVSGDGPADGCPAADRSATGGVASIVGAAAATSGRVTVAGVVTVN